MGDLLETKLQPPPLRPSAVERVRLLDRLGRRDVPRLVLVSAPPGFGKTTLVAQWLAMLHAAGTESAWISLDPTDDDPAVFWAYVVAAVAGVAPEAAAPARARLDAGPAALDGVITALINGLAGHDRELVIVLDDLHVIDGRAIHDGLAFLLEHLPRRIHLAILTRSDPPLPLARMRVRGELAEIRAVDLRFTADEALDYLNERMGLALRGTDVAVLESRTEGWIAALQLAAISLRGRADTGAFIEGFAGDDRFVVDYLADEVLERQPDEVRDFLLSTAVLDRLTGPLCDAVTGGTGSAANLDTLERANLFLVPLDDRRRWYRYHHLFRDLLRSRLLDARPDDVPALHRRASAWWEANGAPAEAIAHAIAGGDVERAADLVEVNAHALRQSRQEATLRRWLDALPDGVFDHRPVLAIAHVGALLAMNEPRGVPARLAAAERWVSAAAGDEARAAAEAAGMVVRHPTALAHLPSAIGVYRAALARMEGDTAATIEHARAAFDAAPGEQPLERGAAAGLLALAHWSNGELEAAFETWTMALADLERAGHHADRLGGLLAMADIRQEQGRPADARRILERGLRLGMEAVPPLRGTADMHTGLAELDREQGDLAAARAHLAASDALGDARELPQNPHRRRVAMAGILAAEGDLAAAAERLDEAEQAFVADYFPEIRPIGALRARLWLRAGRHVDALGWAVERGLTADDPPAYLREFEHRTLAAILVEQARVRGSRAEAATASGLIDRLLAAAEAGGRGRSVIELLALRAIACSVGDDRDGAAAAINRALVLAEPAGYVRLFADLGPGLAGPLRDSMKSAAAPGYAARLLAATVDAAAPAPSAAAATGRQALVEPLSERELEVLRLLAGDLDGPAIASHLYVSLNTLRTHTKNIFAKLGVNSRRAAVTRAAELGLLSRDRRG